MTQTKRIDRPNRDTGNCRKGSSSSSNSNSISRLGNRDNPGHSLKYLRDASLIVITLSLWMMTFMYYQPLNSDYNSRLITMEALQLQSQRVSESDIYSDSEINAILPSKRIQLPRTSDDVEFDIDSSSATYTPSGTVTGTSTSRADKSEEAEQINNDSSTTETTSVEEVEDEAEQVDDDNDNEVGNRTRGANRSKATNVTHQHLINRDFFFSDFKLAYSMNENDPHAGFIGQDAFSASWWQSKRNFLRYDEVEIKSSSPEGASFEVFKINEKNMRVTRDWMDLNVEHMSKWWKGILHPRYNKDTNQKYIERILKIFEDYVYSRDRSFFWDSLDGSNSDWLEVSQSTIAVIAFMPYDEPRITKWSLAATLMSLVELGVGRIVVSGVESDKQGESIISEAWNEITSATKVWKTSRIKQMTTISFCNCGNATNDGSSPKSGPGNVPKTSLRRLRHVFLKNAAEDIRSCWGGLPSLTNMIGDDVMARWKYVFLGEPDLILNTRPSALANLGKALKNGGVLAPHRLQPIPHDSDFGYQKWTDILKFLIPNVPPKLDEIIEIDHYETSSVDTKSVATTAFTSASSCCDDGNKKPYKEFEKCGTWWWQCGFSFFHDSKRSGSSTETINNTLALEAHKRAALYPLVRLKRGTGVVFAGAEQGRRCLPSYEACVSRDRQE